MKFEEVKQAEKIRKEEFTQLMTQELLKEESNNENIAISK